MSRQFNSLKQIQQQRNQTYTTAISKISSSKEGRKKHLSGYGFISVILLVGLIFSLGLNAKLITQMKENGLKVNTTLSALNELEDIFLSNKQHLAGLSDEMKKADTDIKKITRAIENNAAKLNELDKYNENIDVIIKKMVKAQWYIVERMKGFETLFDMLKPAHKKPETDQQLSSVLMKNE